MIMRIKIINLDIITHIFASVEDQEAEWLKAASPGTEVKVSAPLIKGPETEECMYDVAMCTPWILEEIKNSENEGFDAIIIPCMADPGLYAAREIMNIPVIGPAESSFLLAIALGYRFSIMVPTKEGLGFTRHILHTYELDKFVASMRVLDLRVEEIFYDRKKLREALIREGRKAVENDGADVIVMGCGFMSGLVKEIEEEMDVPVIDPWLASMAFTEMLVSLGLSHSKKAYMTPPPKRIKI